MYHKLNGFYIFVETTEVAGVGRLQGHCIKIECNDYEEDHGYQFYFSDIVKPLDREAKVLNLLVCEQELVQYIKTGKLIKYKNSEE